MNSTAQIILAKLLLCALESSFNKECSKNISYCISDADCGTHATCGQLHNCVCPFGYALQEDGRSCKQFQCKRDADCGTNVQCNLNSSICAQKCAAGYVKAYIAPNTCLGMVHSKCLDESGCGVLTKCADHKCECQFGNVRSNNLVDCVPFRCNQTYDCQTEMDLRTECHNHECRCLEGYQLDASQVKCIPKCKFGYEPADADNCQPENCSASAQCTKFSGNAICDVANSKCRCKDGYKLDDKQEKCTIVTSNTKSSSILYANTAWFFIFAVVLLFFRC